MHGVVKNAYRLWRTGCTHLNQILLGWWVGRQIYDEDRIIGAVPRFTVTAPGWMRYPLKIDGQRLWKQWDLGGMNYFKIARSGPHNWSERFNPASRFYQAWLGVYIVRDSDPSATLRSAQDACYGFEQGDEPDPERLTLAAVGDQLYWLDKSGHPNPAMAPRGQIAIERTEQRGHPAWLLAGSFDTFSDIHGTPTAYRLYDASYGIPAEKTWRHLVEPFHPLVMHGFYIAWRWEANCGGGIQSRPGCTVCIYAAGVEFDRQDGVHANTFPLVKDDLLRMAQGITWREL